VEKQLIAELTEGDVLERIADAARWSMFKEFEKATHGVERITLGARCDALAGVMREFKTIANEVAVSGRIDRIA